MRPAPQRVAQAGMSALEEELQGRFDRTRADEKERVKAFDPMAKAFVASLGGEERVRPTLERLARTEDRRRKQKLAPPDVAGPAERIFTGSIGATVVPTYNYQWTWSAQDGGASVGVNANRNNGAIGFDLWNAGQSASASAATAVGFFFRPMVTNGILRISSNPAFNYSWWTSCWLASAHSDGWLGFYVGRYTLAGGFDGAPVFQQSMLWNDDSWFSGAGFHSGSNSGYPLFAQCNVDSAHWYAIWVWCGGRATGAGWGSPFSGSGAGSSLAATVPSITWELF
jgi:hypothetical protein